MKQIPPTLLRQVLLILLIAILFGTIAWNLQFFVPALLGAYTLYIILRKPMFALTDRLKWPIKLSAALLIVISLIIIILPVNWLVIMLKDKALVLFADPEMLLQQLEQHIATLEKQYRITLLTTENLRSLGAWTFGEVQSMIGATVSSAGLLIAAYFILWFMLTAAKRMENSFFQWIPLRSENVGFVQEHMNNLVWSNALGIPLMGVVQGAAGLLIYWLAGIDDPWLWFAITFVAGMMPVVGAALAYMPLSLLLLAQGEEGKALLIFVYGWVVVGSIDNIARMWLLNKISQTHPLITLFGVIVGLQLFGFIGFVFGPILIELFILLLQIYQKEFSDKPE